MTLSFVFCKDDVNSVICVVIWEKVCHFSEAIFSAIVHLFAWCKVSVIDWSLLFFPSFTALFSPPAVAVVLMTISCANITYKCIPQLNKLIQKEPNLTLDIPLQPE